MSNNPSTPDLTPVTNAQGTDPMRRIGQPDGPPEAPAAADPDTTPNNG